MSEAISVVIFVLIIVCVVRIVGCNNDSECETKCGIVKGLSINQVCHCKTETGWEVKK